MSGLFDPLPACPVKARQRWLRIRVAACAYAYEVLNDPIVSDAEYDTLAAQIDPTVSTLEWWHEVERVQRLDAFFREHYSSHTGQWIYKHPEKDLLPRIIKLTRDSSSCRVLLQTKEIDMTKAQLIDTYCGYIKASADAAQNGDTKQAEFFFAKAQEIAAMIEAVR